MKKYLVLIVVFVLALTASTYFILNLQSKNKELKQETIQIQKNTKNKNLNISKDNNFIFLEYKKSNDESVDFSCYDIKNNKLTNLYNSSGENSFVWNNNVLELYGYCVLVGKSEEEKNPCDSFKLIKS